MAKPKKRAINIIKNSQTKSIGTRRSYIQCIKQYLRWCVQNEIERHEESKLSNLTIYLNEIAEIYSQKTICQHRMALNKAYRKEIKFIEASIKTEYASRDYATNEVFEIVKNLNIKNSLSILICYYAGLRAHELATINRLSEATRSSSRKWVDDIFLHSDEGSTYLVTGKGGLRRHVIIPTVLAKELEKFRLETPKKVIDRDIYYHTNYDIGFGQSLSQAFSRASTLTFGWSTGLHGLRHSYAKNRMLCLLSKEVSIHKARLIISQELGHFRPNITNCYFR